jgi:hypothetical protein
MRLDVSIEELVLRGFPAADRHPISEALQHELARLLTSEGTPASFRDGGSIRDVNAGSIRLAAGGGPRKVGAQVARAVYGGLRNGLG